MAKTPTDRYVEIQAVIATLTERGQHLDNRLKELLDDHKNHCDATADYCKRFEMELSHVKRDVGNCGAAVEFCKTLEIELSHFKRDVEELKKWKVTLEAELDLPHFNFDLDELKKWRAGLEEEQKDRKKWHRSFGPNVTAAVLTIILAPLSVFFWNWISSLVRRGQ